MSPMSTPKGAESLRTDDANLESLAEKPKDRVGGLANWLDERTGAAKPMSYLLKKVFPDHWSFMLGEIAMFSLIVLLITGTFLTFWFVPSAGQVIYNGSYVPLKGIPMSEAFKSTLDISSADQWWIWRMISPPRTSKLMSTVDLNASLIGMPLSGT